MTIRNNPLINILSSCHSKTQKIPPLWNYIENINRVLDASPVNRIIEQNFFSLPKKYIKRSSLLYFIKLYVLNEKRCCHGCDHEVIWFISTNTIKCLLHVWLVSLTCNHCQLYSNTILREQISQWFIERGSE